MRSEEDMLQMSFEAWKFQVDAYWTRTSYFALFELAFAAGVWKVFTDNHWFTSAGMAAGAEVLTIVWIVNNARLHEYIDYYYRRIMHFEAALGLVGEGSIFSRFEDNRRKCPPGSYHIYVQLIPSLFLLGWGWMLCWSICNLHSMFHHLAN